MNLNIGNIGVWELRMIRCFFNRGIDLLLIIGYNTI